MLDSDNGDSSIRKKMYKIGVPIFGAAKAQKFYTDLGLYQQC